MFEEESKIKWELVGRFNPGEFHRSENSLRPHKMLTVGIRRRCDVEWQRQRTDLKG